MPEFDPLQYANSYGIRVVKRNFKRIRRYWSQQERTILIQIGMPDHQRRGTLGHLLGHAMLGHRYCHAPEGHMVDTPEEVAADKWAARKLVNRATYNTHRDLDIFKLALILGITTEQARLYRRHYGGFHAQSWQPHPPLERATASGSLPAPVNIQRRVDQSRVPGTHHPRIRGA